MAQRYKFECFCDVSSRQMVICVPFRTAGVIEKIDELRIKIVAESTVRIIYCAVCQKIWLSASFRLKMMSRGIDGENSFEYEAANGMKKRTVRLVRRLQMLLESIEKSIETRSPQT